MRSTSHYFFCMGGDISMTENELYHHGIKGQRWGKRNGPPYPLSEDDHSLSEKKAGWKKSLDSNSEHEKNGFRLTDKQKKYLKIGAAIAGTAIVAYGAYRINSDFKSAIGEKLLSFDSSVKNKLYSEDVANMSNEDHMKAINKFYGIVGGKSMNNCSLCTTAFDLRKRGYNVSASFLKGGKSTSDQEKFFAHGEADGSTREFTTVAELFGIPKPPTLDDAGQNIQKLKELQDDYNSMLSKHKTTRGDIYKTLEKKLLSYGNGARGNLNGSYPRIGGGHSIIWEIVDNKVVFMDAQVGKIYKPGSMKALSDFQATSLRFMRTDDLVLRDDNPYIAEAVRYNQKDNVVSRFMTMGANSMKATTLALLNLTNE